MKIGTEHIGVMAALGIVFGIAWLSTQIPVVEVSFTTKKCMKVWDISRQYSCDNMPNKYIREWVK